MNAKNLLLCLILTCSNKLFGLLVLHGVDCVSCHHLFLKHIKDWEIMDDLQMDLATGGETLQDLSMPGICEGYLMKRRKWPLKGWHRVSKGFCPVPSG